MSLDLIGIELDKLRLSERKCLRVTFKLIESML